MPFTGGSFSLYQPGNPVVTNTAISSAWANNTLSDIATGLSTCVLKDGTQTITANIPMSGYKLTGLAAGTTAGDSMRYEQVVGAYLPITGGTLTGNLLFTDATYDIGASGATRPRDLYLSRNAVIGGTTSFGGNVVSNLLFTDATYDIGQSGATRPRHLYLSGNIVAGGSFTGTLASAVTATTQSAGDNSTKVATTAYADRLGITLSTEQASTSGTNVDFNGVPSGVKRITVMFEGVSLSGTSTILIQLGDAGGIENTGYVSSGTRAEQASTSSVTTSTSGFVVFTNQSGSALHGSIIFSLYDSANFSWAAQGVFGNVSGTAYVYMSAGTKSLSAELTQLRITTGNGTDTFDAGSINIAYEY